MNMKRSLICAAVSALVVSVEAAPVPRVKEPSVPRTADEIIALPRRATTKTKMPAEGIYIGSGAYRCDGRLLLSGFCFTYWEPTYPKFEEQIDLCAKEKVGNLLQFWRGGNEGCKWARKAREKGLYSVFMYGQPGDSDEDTQKFVAELGDAYLGFDFGECFSMNVNDLKPEARKKGDLQMFVDRYMNCVNEYVTKLHKKGVGNVQATSANFGIDYEVAAGAELFRLFGFSEDFRHAHHALAAAIVKGHTDRAHEDRENGDGDAVVEHFADGGHQFAGVQRDRLAWFQVDLEVRVTPAKVAQGLNQQRDIVAALGDVVTAAEVNPLQPRQEFPELALEVRQGAREHLCALFAHGVEVQPLQSLEVFGADELAWNPEARTGDAGVVDVVFDLAVAGVHAQRRRG